MIAAKNASALREMNEIIKHRCVKKTYLAALHGVPKPLEGEISLLLEKDSANNIVRVRDKRINSGVKTAVTLYRTVSVSADRKLSLVEIELVTGRTHQIRASFAHIGNPLLGDGKYAVNKEDREKGFDHQALCAFRLEFRDISDYPTLNYLSGKSFTANEPKFLELFK